MLLIICAILLIAWLLGMLGGVGSLIHLLLAVCLIAIIVHLITGRSVE